MTSEREAHAKVHEQLMNTIDAIANYVVQIDNAVVMNVRRIDDTLLTIRSEIGVLANLIKGDGKWPTNANWNFY